MPIIKAKESTPAIIRPSIPLIHAPEHVSVVVDSRYDPLASLVSYVEGSAWTVNYYSQVLAKDSAVYGQDVGKDAVYQQYKLIKLMELKVSTPLSWSQDKASKGITATGGAMVHSYLIPNEGDMFCADVGDGREGVFEIHLSEKKSLLSGSVYYIEYTLLYFSDDKETVRADLDKKVVQTVHYVKDFLLHGQNPMVVDSDYNALEELRYKYEEIVKNYFRWFFSKEFNTILVPGQDGTVYDHYVTKTMASILDTREDPHLRYMRVLNVDDDNTLKQPQLWTALVNRDALDVEVGNRIMGLCHTNMFTRNPMTEGIRYTGIRWIVYPKQHPDNADTFNNRLDKVIGDTNLIPVPTASGSLLDLIYDKVLEFNGQNVKVINGVLADDHYVFSQAFYDEINGQSLLEVLTRNYLQKEAIDPKVLLGLVNHYPGWGGLEKFYYLPIILILIKSVIRNM